MTLYMIWGSDGVMILCVVCDWLCPTPAQCFLEFWLSLSAHQPRRFNLFFCNLPLESLAAMHAPSRRLTHSVCQGAA